MTYYCVSLDAAGEILTIAKASTQDKANGGAHPNAASTVTTAPPGDDYYWDGDSWVAKGSPPDDNHTWDVVEKEWVDPRTLEQLKADKWLEIKAARDAARDEPYSDGTHTFENLAENRAQLAVIIEAHAADIAAGAADTYPMTGTLISTGATESVSFTLAGLKTLLRQMNLITKAAMITGRGLKIDIEEAEDAAAVAAIEWP